MNIDDIFKEIGKILLMKFNNESIDSSLIFFSLLLSFILEINELLPL